MWMEGRREGWICSASGVVVLGFWVVVVGAGGKFRVSSRFEFSKIPSLPGKARFGGVGAI